MALIYDATFNTSTRLLTFLDRSGNTIYSFTVPARGIVDDPTKPLYLLSKQNGSTVTLTMVGTVTETYEYSTDEVTWTPLAFDTPITLDSGEGVYVRSVNTRTQTQSSSRYVQFVMTGEIEAYHNINSMLTPSGFNISDLLDIQNSKYAFACLFRDQTALTKAPVLYPTTLSDYCYYQLFYGCSNVNKIQINATSFSFSNCLASWDTGVSATGDFYCYDEYMYNHGASTSGIPYGWTVHSIVTHDDDIEKPLYFVSKQNGSTLSLSVVGSIIDSYKTSSDGINWTDYTLGDTITLNNNEGVYFSIKASLSSRSSSKYVKFSGTGAWEAYHNINSMVNPSFADLNSIDVNYGLINLFNGMSSLQRAPLLPSKAIYQHCYDAMFKDTSITTPPVLYPHTLTSYCYSSMFEGSTITRVPALPVMQLTSQCYRNMFRNCTSITSATLPAVSLASGCYYQMFYGCSSLNEVHISAKTSINTTNLENWLSGVAATGNFYCYDDSTYTVDSASGIPVGWTVHSQVLNDNENKPLTFISEADGSTVSLKQASNDPNGYETSTDGTTWSAYTSETPITLNNGDSVAFRAAQTRSVAQTGSAYAQFSTTGIIKACHNINSLLSPTFASLSDLTSFGNFLFYQMFKDNANLYRAPLLPGTALGSYAYVSLFEGTSITAAPALPATIIGTYAYNNTFKSCASLTTPPVISAVDNLPANAFTGMFRNCTSLTQTPVLNAKVVPSEAYDSMFYGCSSLNAVYVYAENISEISSLDRVPTFEWLSGVAATGTFHCYTSAIFRRGVNGIPTGWTIDSQTGNDDAALPLTFVSKANGSKVTFSPQNAIFQTSTDGGTTWTDHSSNTSFTITLNNGDSVAIKAKANLIGNQSSTTYRQFTITGTVEAYHNVLSVIRASDWNDYNSRLPQYAFYQLFYNCTGLTRSPMLLPTSLNNYCYDGMFYGCTGLTSAPVLPATTLASYCYHQMFYGCTGLTSAPVLPATTLRVACYYQMFRGCSGLTSAPALPANTLANSCYRQMFYECTKLKKAPALPAATLIDYCYYYMFYGCSSLNEVRISATDISAENCLSNWLVGVSGTGDFYCVQGVNYPSGTSGKLSFWTTHYI